MNPNNHLILWIDQSIRVIFFPKKILQHVPTISMYNQYVMFFALGPTIISHLEDCSRLQIYAAPSFIYIVLLFSVTIIVNVTKRSNKKNYRFSGTHKLYLIFCLEVLCLELSIQGTNTLFSTSYSISEIRNLIS